MNQNQFEFKPFDKVLVRDVNTQQWKCGIFSHRNEGTQLGYECVGSVYVQCIPYNEETKHLLGTANNYQKQEPQEPKEYHVWTSGTFNQWFTKTEFENFIKTAVINNKDISDFHVLYVKCNN